MENEWREREEPKVRYEQQSAGGKSNPMDAVKNKAPKAGLFGKKKTAAAPQAEKSGNEWREREPEAPKADKTEKSAPKAKKPAAPKRANLLVQVLNGDILTRDFVLNNLTFIFFILLLLLLMVGKGYYGKQLTKDINDLQTEVDASTAEYIENKARLEESTARYRLVEALEPRGLKETVNPAKVIRIKRKEK